MPNNLGIAIVKLHTKVFFEIATVAILTNKKPNRINVTVKREQCRVIPGIVYSP